MAVIHTAPSLSARWKHDSNLIPINIGSNTIHNQHAVINKNKQYPTSEINFKGSTPIQLQINSEFDRSYLENFGYLKKGQPEMANLLLGDVAQSYEDDFRIAIKTLQEFGGIPVTGEIDEATRELIKKKRCGRPDREEGDIEDGRRKKRFAVQGEKWKYTNLTWR
ncbi:Matrix metalloproteinase-16 [Papilio machaon]|uniref:Matrix metalloproteinase-16 n=1 Tax=Papilio machaon TaxID=76193 RepID=A0A194QU76_PAPMA|nr:Matrix metalloproteinase-16 [Papilio machaon]